MTSQLDLGWPQFGGVSTVPAVTEPSPEHIPEQLCAPSSTHRDRENRVNTKRRNADQGSLHLPAPLIYSSTESSPSSPAAMAQPLQPSDTTEFPPSPLLHKYPRSHMADGRQKIKVGVLGATGTVGQRFIVLLSQHPWFVLHKLGASPRSAGKPYARAVTWKQAVPIPTVAADIIVHPCEPEHFTDCPVVFSGLDADVAGDIGT